MAYDFTTFTKVEPGTEYGTITATNIPITGMARNVDAYLSTPETNAGDYKFDYEFILDSASDAGSIIHPLILSTVLDDAKTHQDNGTGTGCYATSSAGAVIFYLILAGGSSLATGTYALNTRYYITHERVGLAVTLSIYSDSARTTLVGSATLSHVTTAQSMNYIQVATSFNSANVNNAIGTVSNLADSTQTSASITYTNSDDVVAIAANLNLPIAQISYTNADDTVDIQAEIASKTDLTYTNSDDVVAIAAALDIPTVQVSYTNADDTTDVQADIINKASVVFTNADDIVGITVGLPTSANVQYSNNDDTVSILATVSSVIEPFSVTIRDRLGAPITGLTTVYLKSNRPADNYRWDFSDSSFKITPITESLVLAEVDAINQAGKYRSNVTTTTWAGWIESEVTYNDGTTIHSFPDEAYYSNGVRANGAWSIAEIQKIDAIPTVAEIWAKIIETNGSITAQQAISLVLAAVAGEYDKNTGTFKDPSGTSDRIVGTADAQGNRSAITVTPS